jgi:hypothetical protein
VWLLTGIDASAQDFTGNIYGRIVDPSNAVMPGVTITVEGAAIQIQRKTESGTNGSYRFTYLAPGEYRVTFEKPGFKKIVHESTKVELGRTVSIDVTMQIADVGETVVVTSSSPIVDVRNATVGAVWGATFLRDIPNQRDIFALLSMTPGITMQRPDIGGNRAGEQSEYRAYGVLGQSKTTVEGVDITVRSGLGAYIDFGALAEAKVSGAGNAADVPGAGAAVTMVIRSGGNTHHGEFFADVKPRTITSGESFTAYPTNREPRVNSETYRQYRDVNAHLGGPFIKDKLWFFTSFRDQYTAFRTGMWDYPAWAGGTQGQPYITDTTNYTVKLNYQLSRQSTLTFMTQWGWKYQPYRGGSGSTAYNYLVESTARQDSRTQIGKVDYMRVINNRATLDASLSSFGSRFPLAAHIDKTPIIDDATAARSGAYNRPNLTQDRRWQFNTTLNFYAGNHDMRIGYIYQWYVPRDTEYGSPGPAGSVGHFYIQTTNSVPSSFFTDNGPVSDVNILKNHALFFQDKFQMTSKLTLNYGIRFDQYNSSYPEQRFGLNGDQPCVDANHCDVGPFGVEMVTPARDVVTFYNVVPRVAGIYDLFGNAKTALKASWGRFATDPAGFIAASVNPIDLISTEYAWNSSDLTLDSAVAATRITPEYVATLRPINGGQQLTPATVDPKLKNSYIDEYTFGVEQEIAADLRVHFTSVRKHEKNSYGKYDRFRTLSAYTPVRALDPGPDGVFNADDRPITVWETDVPAGNTDLYVTNKPIGDTYTTFEFGVMKRLRDHWQLTSGVDWTKLDLSSEFSENPNTLFLTSNNRQTTGWTFKASGSYLFKHGVMVAAFFNSMKGAPYGRSLLVNQQNLRLADPNRTTPLRQGNLSIAAEKVGSHYLPAINVINIRVQKEFVIKDSHRLHLMFNVFHPFNARTMTGVVQTTGSNYGLPTTTIGETVIRLSMRYAF